MQATRTHYTWFTAVSCLLMGALAGCGADAADSSGRRNPLGAANPAIPTLPGAGSFGPGVAPAGAGRSGMPGDFGSPTTLLPMADPNAIGGGCHNATVAFVIDGSGSMCEPFGNSTRWTELRLALLQKDVGLIFKLDSLASFGLYLYDGSIDTSLMGGGGAMSSCVSPGSFRRINMGACPGLVEVKPAMRNYARINQAYPAGELGGSTPTDKAMNFVVNQLIAARGPTGKSADPQFIILATDGEPNDICMGGTGGDGSAQKAGVVAAADRAAAADITTFVISLASDPALQMHLDEVARHGNRADATAHAFTPINSADLTMTLTKLLGSAVGCLF